MKLKAIAEAAHPTRKVTRALINMMDQGVLDPRSLADTCLGYMSEDEVADMARTNDLVDHDEESESEYT